MTTLPECYKTLIFCTGEGEGGGGGGGGAHWFSPWNSGGAPPLAKTSSYATVLEYKKTYIYTWLLIAIRSDIDSAANP